MFRNVYYDFRNSKMHLWYTVKGTRLYDVYDWVPYVYVKTITSEIKSIYGDDVVKREFRSYWEYVEFCKKNKHIFENNVLPGIQFLVERFGMIPDDELEKPELTIVTVDIEVYTSESFPSYNNPIDPITLISCHNSTNDNIYTFGFKDCTYTTTSRHYIKCVDEKDMLLKFIRYIRSLEPDVISGWNTDKFDIPYIIERIKYLYGDDTNVFHLISPLNIVSTWRNNKDEYTFDIAGICHLDYLQVYKAYTENRLENYKLDTVAREELGVGKLSYSEYTSLNDLYDRNFNMFVEYNQIDVYRVAQIEAKREYIKSNILGQSLLTRVPMMYYGSQTKLIEGALLTYYRRNNLCAPALAEGRHLEFPGGDVKPPIPGIYEYIVDLDITSSYPSHIIALNMSLETYFGRIVDLNRDEILTAAVKKNFPAFTLKTSKGIKKIEGKLLDSFNKAFKQKLFTIAPCGVLFVTNQEGVIPKVQYSYFMKRKELKKKLFKIKQEINTLTNAGGAVEQIAELTKLRDKYHAFQLAIKIILNSTYGATSVEYSRYFNLDIAEAITTCGVNTVLKGGDFVNACMADESIINHVRSLMKDKYGVL